MFRWRQMHKSCQYSKLFRLAKFVFSIDQLTCIMNLKFNQWFLYEMSRRQVFAGAFTFEIKTFPFRGRWRSLWALRKLSIFRFCGPTLLLFVTFILWSDFFYGFVLHNVQKLHCQFRKSLHNSWIISVNGVYMLEELHKRLKLRFP